MLGPKKNSNLRMVILQVKTALSDMPLMILLFTLYTAVGVELAALTHKSRFFLETVSAVLANFALVDRKNRRSALEHQLTFGKISIGYHFHVEGI